MRHQAHSRRLVVTVPDQPTEQPVSRPHRVVSLFLLALLLALAAPRTADAETREVPLPVGRTAVLKVRDVVYVVEGRVTIRADAASWKSLYEKQGSFS